MRQIKIYHNLYRNFYTFLAYALDSLEERPGDAPFLFADSLSPCCLSCLQTRPGFISPIAILSARLKMDRLADRPALFYASASCPLLPVFSSIPILIAANAAMSGFTAFRHSISLWLYKFFHSSLLRSIRAAFCVTCKYCLTFLSDNR